MIKLLLFQFLFDKTVGNIPYDATEEQLIQICEEVGPVVSFRFVISKLIAIFVNFLRIFKTLADCTVNSRIYCSLK